MNQEKFELQLQVWKDLAISKQVLMGAATDALGLDPDCGTDELKSALNTAIKRSVSADADISNAREQARFAVEEMEQKTRRLEIERNEAIEARRKAESAVDSMEKQVTAARAANAEEIKKAKKQLIEEQKKLKAINVSLGDTPDNVVKKLKALKKQKMEHADGRKRAEDATRAIRKEKQTLEKKLSNVEAAIKDSGDLLEKYRELCETSKMMHKLLEDHDEKPELPELNEKLLESIEAAVKSLEDQ